MKTFSLIAVALAALTFAGCQSTVDNTTNAVECALRPQTCTK